jgi:CPA1 family monovalent cation:H+ antiporter
MEPTALILILFTLITALSLFAVKLRIPYPTAMVLAGLIIGLIVYLFPQLNGLSIRLDPKVLFTAVLPPLLYAGAWMTSWNDFKRNLRPIFLLAVWAVILTTVGIAVMAHYFLPGFSWPLAFLLGAIVSPPDAVAVTAILERLHIPKRIVTILEGESLVNDASALVVYKFALAAVMTGAFSFPAAALQFPVVAGGGILIGLAMAFIVRRIHERIEQPNIETAITLLTPYAAYLLAEECHTSGVLAVVATGIALSRHAHRIFSPQTRLIVMSFWAFFIFVLNGLVFILIGLQLPTILRSVRIPLVTALGYAGLVCLALIVIRMLLVIPARYLPPILPAFRFLPKQEPPPPKQHVLFIGWVGMRGVVSLAAALAVPELLTNSAGGEFPFPMRDQILFLAFAVILATLVVQSLTLPGIVRLFHLRSAASSNRCDEAEARRQALTAALDLLSQHPPSHATTALSAHYTHRLEHITDCQEQPDLPDPEAALHHRTLQTQRNVLVRLRDQGRIADDLLRKLERELDLEESQLPSE